MTKHDDYDDTPQGKLTHIAAILAAFYRAPISCSSLQPVLDLAVELNPDLKGKP